MPSLLTTERLILRPLTPGDAEPTARIMSPTIARWTGAWKGSETADEVSERIASSLGAEQAGRRLMRAVCLAQTGELIGWIGVLRLDDPKRGSLGYWLGEAGGGRGYAQGAGRGTG